MECLSELSGATFGTAVKKPQCSRFNFISAIEELENDADEDFIKNLENGETIGYETYLGNCPEDLADKQNSASMAKSEVSRVIIKLS